MEQTKLHEKRFAQLINTKVRCVYLETAAQFEENRPFETQTVESSAVALACSCCKAEFSDVGRQREHYKLDWHRYNLKRSLSGREGLTEEQFLEKNDDVSSISGSESEKEDNLDQIAAAQGKIFLENPTAPDTKTVFSLYKCLIFNKKEEITDVVLQQRLQTLSHADKWCVLMLGGGHFAGAIFHGGVAVLHKTFHCYTVRAGQGGGQSGRDNKSGGSQQPKSAGASLRRYNEQALVQHVRDIVDAWKKEIADCNLIMYRASGPYNRAVLFDGKPAILERTDPRLRTIPFSTRRPTFTEVKRVYDLLTTVQIYSSLDDALKNVVKQNSKRAKTKNTSINRAKSREIANKSQAFERKKESSSSSDEEENSELLENLDKLTLANAELTTHDQEISFKNDLQAFDDSLTAQERKRVYAIKKKAPKKSKNKKIKEREQKRKQETVALIKNGDLAALTAFFDCYVNNNCDAESDADVKTKVFNECLDENNNTPLHLAAAYEQVNVVLYLLENDANPCHKNAKQQTPYTITQNKEIREVFKQFAQENPAKFNYNKAHIPLVVLSAEEAAEKKRQLRKCKREKEKVKKREIQIKMAEEREIQKFLGLSDTEKRELRAVARCFLCGGDMTGKVPFEYLKNNFCSVGCVKEHRLKHGVVLS